MVGFADLLHNKDWTIALPHDPLIEHFSSMLLIPYPLGNNTRNAYQFLETPSITPDWANGSRYRFRPDINIFITEYIKNRKAAVLTVPLLNAFIKDKLAGDIEYDWKATIGELAFVASRNPFGFATGVRAMFESMHFRNQHTDAALLHDLRYRSRRNETLAWLSFAGSIGYSDRDITVLVQQATELRKGFDFVAPYLSAGIDNIAEMVSLDAAGVDNNYLPEVVRGKKEPLAI